MLSTQVNLLKGLSVMTLQGCAQYNKQAQKKKFYPLLIAQQQNVWLWITQVWKPNRANHRCVFATTDPIPDKPSGGGSGESSADIVFIRDLNWANWTLVSPNSVHLSTASGRSLDLEVAVQPFCCVTILNVLKISSVMSKSCGQSTHLTATLGSD